MIAIVLFLVLGGHRMVLMALGRSFEVIPLGGACFPPSTGEGIMRLFTQMTLIAVQIAAPVLASVFLVEVVIGVLSRGVPQLNIFTVGLALRIVVGLLVLIATTPVLVGITKHFLAALPHELHALLTELAP
jgi:flagellar biosynthetic protein FliR